MIAVQPQLKREYNRAFDITSLVKGEPADYSVGQYSFEVYLHQAFNVDNKARPIAKAVPGDLIYLYPKVAMKIKNRIVEVEAHQKLYDYGTPSFKRRWHHGETLNCVITWHCLRELNMKDLPFLFQVYIDDQHVR